MLKATELSRDHHGQHKTVVPIITEDGCVYPVISHLSKNERRALESVPFPRGRGARPMHRSTFKIGKSPWALDYSTTSKWVYGGSKGLNPAKRPYLCPSMHVSQVDLRYDDKMSWDSHYKDTFHEKDIVPANKLHLTSLVHRIDQTEGIQMKANIKMHENPTNYWSQYNRIHGKLGGVLGTGEPRSYPIRQSFNVITGENSGPCWSPENRKSSGNRILHARRKEQDNIPIIS